MKRISLVAGGILGGFTALTVAALTYLGNHFFGLPFVPFDIFDWMARVLPGTLINAVIDTIVRIIQGLNLGPTASTAKTIEQSIAMLQFVIAGGIFGIILAALGRRWPARLSPFGALGGALLWIPVIAIEAYLGYGAAGIVTVSPLVDIVWLFLVFSGSGAVLGRLLRETTPVPVSHPESNLSRRQFLYLVGAGSFTMLVSALGVVVLSGESTNQQPSPSGVQISSQDTAGSAASPPENELAARIKPVPGTRSELTSNADFYRIDIDAIPPSVDGSSWRLKVSGLVDNPLSLSLDDLRARPSISQVITLECISNPVGGDLISTAMFTGVRLKDILKEAGLKDSVQELAIQAADGFYESVSMADMMDDRTLLVYEMNGQPLPTAHGYPLRIYVPNHFGMKQPKWITQMEAIDHKGAGYWVDRGWSAEAIVQTTSVIDVVAANLEDPQTHLVPIGGIAYAGARGISKVEIQIDDQPWQPAELRDPPLSPLTWVQWRYAWQAAAGGHTVRVRAYDGTGALQDANIAQPYPNGARGDDTVSANIPG